MSTRVLAAPLAARRALAPAFFAALLGIGLLYVTGFAESAQLHNAAHDGRHAFAFPCH